MRSWEQRERRKQDIKHRASTVHSLFGSCRAVGCNKPVRAATSDGVGMRFCRRHYEHHQRHGNPFKKTYAAKELNPYRQAALQWLLDHPDDRWGAQAVEKVWRLYRRAGPHVEAFRLTGMTPRERAWAHWARLRAHNVDARLPVAAWVAVEMILHDDREADWRKEYKLVQAAKVVHRMASGSHRKWVREFSFGNRTEEIHVYPRPRGRILRYIGEDLESACELLVERHLADLHALKEERDKAGNFASSPYPRGWSARQRKRSSNLG